MNLSERVYFYMPDNNADDQSNRGKFNCAEAMFLAINDNYGLDISEDGKTQMAAFGGGLGVGDVCGLLIGGYAALAHMYASKTSPKGSKALRSVCREWYVRFNVEFDTVDCNKMKPDTGGCSGHGMAAAKVFEQLINDVGY